MAIPRSNIDEGDYAPGGNPNVDAVRKHLHTYLTKENRNDAWTGLSDANVKAILSCQPCNVKQLPSQTAAINGANCSICEKTAWSQKLAPKLQPMGPKSKGMPPVPIGTLTQLELAN